MTFLEKQGHLLEQLANMLYNSFDGDFDILKAEYEVLSAFGTISTSLSYVKDGKEQYFEAPLGVASQNLDLCSDLRVLMKAHTGGEWTSFTLTLDANGKAHTKFHYPDDQA